LRFYRLGSNSDDLEDSSKKIKAECGNILARRLHIRLYLDFLFTDRVFVLLFAFE
jgi:hypothetical protein